MRILGLDVGEKKVGISISDPSNKIALGLKILKRGKIEDDLKELERIKELYEVKRIVVGLPKDLNGKIGKRAKDTISYKEAIEKRLKIPCELWDERFTTNEAKRVYELFGIKSKRRKRSLDITSAQLILQGYLDAQNH